MRIASVVVYPVLQIACLPLALVGAVLVIYRQLIVSRRLGASHTASRVLGHRWLMHVFGIRENPAAVRLASVQPNAGVLGYWLIFFPLWIAYRMRGAPLGYPRVPTPGREAVGDTVVARTVRIDRMLARLAGDVEQLVLLGGGYDTRAYGALKRDGRAWFEMDRAATQRLKVAGLRRAGIDAAHVTFVEVDFGREDAFRKLREQGFDPEKRTLFLWEGVTIYLWEREVRKTLRDVRRHASPGSALVADFYAERVIRYASGALARWTLSLTQEEFRFGLPFETDWDQTLRRFLESEGLHAEEIDFMGRANPRGPFGAVVACRL